MDKIVMLTIRKVENWKSGEPTTSWWEVYGSDGEVKAYAVTYEAAEAALEALLLPTS